MKNLNIFNHKIYLATTRLVMRPLNYADISILAEVAINDEIWQTYSFSISNIDELKNYVIKYINEKNENKRYTFILESLYDSKVIGLSSIYNFGKDEVEIGGTWIGIPFQKLYYNFESKFLLLSFCFEYLNLKRVVFHTDSRNYKSLSLYNKIGAKFYYTKKSKHLNEFGENRESLYYKMELETWKEIKYNVFDNLVSSKTLP